MTHHARRWPLVGLVLAVVAASSPAGAQYFGRNKVQYERFDFGIMKADHFDHYYYPAESLATADMARAGERWFTRLSDIFRHQFDRKAIVWYADHPDFQQTNVVGGSIEEGTGGITEGMRTRVVMPHTGSYWDTHHVLGHEIVHVFQYNIAEAGPGGLNRLAALPLWLIEGMAEYLSLGRNDPLTAMWLRDATLRDRLPTVKQLTTDPRFFPYRYGQALWAYVAGRYGDRAVVDVFRASLRVGWDQALIRVLGVNQDSLSKDWIASIKTYYTPLIADRTRPEQAGDPVLRQGKDGGDYNLAPTVSPDGKYVAFFSRRGLFTIDLFVADASTGRIVKKLAGPTSDSHFDAISFISSSGDWSPDARKFAFIAFAQGNHEVAILDVASGDIERKIKLPGVGAVNNVAWSPDGRTLALSGNKGGLSDLYLLDVASEQIRQLTNDRHADIHPAWSPDGRTIAFSTDRSARTNFEQMTFGHLQLATIDVSSGQVTVLSPFPNAKQINPQFAPDGQSIFFVSDQDGFSDIYRVAVAGGAVSRVTRVATGVSGITHTSPAISVARNNGRLLFSVFDRQGWGVYGLDAARTVGQPVTPAAVATGGILPPGDTPGRAVVSSYLADASGLAPVGSLEHAAYSPSFSLDAIGQPSIGVSAGGPFGTGVAGGVSFLFGDQLGDQQIFSAVQANGTVQDIGGQVVYLNSKRRLNWGVGLEHSPYLTGGIAVGRNSDGTIQYDTYLERIFVDQGSLFSQYPFSTTRRLELGVSATRLGFSTQIDRIITDPSGTIVLGRTLKDTTARDPLFYGQGSMALVGDNAFSAFTGPVSGQRYRFEVSPTVGTITMNTVLADYRRYFFARPVTLAFRGIHYGRYGKDSENYNMLSPLYLGEETIMRGYGWNSIEPQECAEGSTTILNCPVIARLLGSRLATASAELRIPFFGTSEFGLINFPYLPLEVAPFFDAGVMWTADQRPDFSSANGEEVLRECAQGVPCARRTPVYSTGVSFRMNVLGYMIFEAYLAKPFQRPSKDWVWGFQLAPGW